MIRTRFAPSPTGFLHIGSLRTALYAFALAKHKNGDFILRIEDTDQKREVVGSKMAIQNTLKEFGLLWDEYYVQSERQKKGIYLQKAEKLISEGNAFYCQCEAKNAKDGYSKTLRDLCRDKNLIEGAIKLKVPKGKIVSYTDFVHKKEISWNTDDVYDATLLKTDGFPTYHLAAMVDDIEMNVTHILRGHDWLPSTPVHLLILDYLKGDRPEIGHLTDILSVETGKKLSKRRDSVFVEQFLKEGYIPEALLNFIMLLGWAPKNNREVYTLEEFVKEFDGNGFQSANPKFSKDKLTWFNQQYIQKQSFEKLKSQLFNYFGGKYEENLIGDIIPLVQTRISTFEEFESMAKFFVKRPTVDVKLFESDYKSHLEVAYLTLTSLEDWKLKNLNDSLMAAINEKEFKVGKFFMSLRIAITGQKFTPPINESIILLGKKETLKRLKLVLAYSKN